MVTWAEWFKAAQTRGIDLRSVLDIDVQRDLDALYSSGLPVYDRIFVDGDSLHSKIEYIQVFSSRHPLMWARVISKNDPGERYFRLGLKTISDLTDFLDQVLPRSVDQYSLQLFEFVENKMSGNILSSPDRSIVEMIYGIQIPLARGLVTPFHAQTNQLGRLVFESQDTPVDIRTAANKAVRYVRCSRGEYQPGYYEFVVGQEGRVIFVGMNTKIR
ncbi:MAG: hypothetical protein AABX47_03105 [Nanoarchaeota archaeon]